MNSDSNSLLHRLLKYFFWILLLVIPVLSFGPSLDPHYSVGFMFLLAAFSIAALSNQFSLNKDAVWIGGLSLIIVICQMMFSEIQFEDAILTFSGLLVVLAIPRNSFAQDKMLKSLAWIFWAGYSIVLIGSLLWRMQENDYSHGMTYLVQPLFAHRNIAIEFYAILSLGMFYLIDKRILKWLIVIVLSGITIIFQVRTVILLIGLLVLIQNKALVPRKSIFFKIGLSLFLFGMLSQLILIILPWDTYKTIFDSLPDWAKSLDVAYNLKNAQSSKDRMVLWGWTIDHITFFGEGIGQWKVASQGYVNELLGRCDIAVRRPHSDIIRLFFEWGIVPMMLISAGVLFHLKKHLVQLLPLLPILAFSFALERAEHLVAIFFLMQVLKSRQDESDRRIVTKMKGIPKFSLAIVTICMFGLSLFWMNSQNIFGELSRNKISLRDLTGWDKSSVEIFRKDAALNSLEVYQAIHLIDGEKEEVATDFLFDYCAEYPNDQAALRLLVKMNAQLPENAFLCNSNN